MGKAETGRLVENLVGSAQVFVSAVSEVMEQKLLAEIAGDRLTVSQIKILKLLEVTEARTIGDVAAFLGVSDAAASKAVERLVRKQYLRRTERRADRRSADITVAPAGRTLLNRYESVKRQRLTKMFADLEPEELQHTAEILDRLTKGIVVESGNPQDICLQCGIHSRKGCLVRDAARVDCSYKLRANKRRTRDHGTPSEVSKGGGPGVGPSS
jgi:DNA-binding MarR family transcriptional regulator